MDGEEQVKILPAASMTSEEIEILCEAIAAECNTKAVCYDTLYREIIIDPDNKRRSTKILRLRGNNVHVCSRGYQFYNIYDPDSIPKIAKAINFCIKQFDCDSCQYWLYGDPRAKSDE